MNGLQINKFNDVIFIFKQTILLYKFLFKTRTNIFLEILLLIKLASTTNAFSSDRTHHHLKQKLRIGQRSFHISRHLNYQSDNQCRCCNAIYVYSNKTPSRRYYFYPLDFTYNSTEKNSLYAIK